MDKKTGLMMIKLGDKDVELKGNWKCVQMLEQRLNKGIIQFAVNDLQNLNIGVGTLGHIYYSGMRANKDTRLTYDEICQLIIEDGIMGHMQPAIEFISSITSPGEDEAEDTGEKKE